MALKKSRLLHWVLILATMLMVVGSSLPIVAYANGRVTDFERKTAGPYEIALGTVPPSPLVGSLHFTIAITEVATNALVLDAQIVVVGTGPESSGNEIGPIVAVNNLQDPSSYDVNTVVDREGIWVFTMTIIDSDGEHSAAFQVEVKNASPITGILTLGVLVAFLVIFGLSIRASLGGRRKRSKKQNA
jgi:hypothetical protein